MQTLHSFKLLLFMCYTNLRHYAVRHKKYTIFCSSVFIISIFLTALVYFFHSGREQFVLEVDGSRAPIHHVLIKTNHLVPDALSIHIGEYVQFNTDDGRTHEIGLGGGEEYSDDHAHVDPEFESTEFGGNDAYRVKFSTTGVYDFHDHLHPELFVTVIVSSSTKE